jgi:two-component system, NtrC family, sensor histidine kinase HydH
MMSSETGIDDQERERLRTQYAEIATLAGGLAHEIKNPLSTIGMNLELMSEDLSPDDSVRDRRLVKKIATVQRECRHLEDILNAFLEFARAGEIDSVRTDLNEFVSDFMEFYQPHADEYGLEISPHLATNLPAVNIDRSLFRQVLMNLVLNAHQAMPDGGLLELQTHQRGGRVFLDLIDTGVGMDEGTRLKMFQTFFSTRSGGSGLGLPTVRKIIEAHRGEISCDSEPGRGTRFTVSLPVAESPS